MKLDNIIQGASLSWEVEDPLSEDRQVGNYSFSHSNSIKGLLLKRNDYRKKVMKAVTDGNHKWRVEISITFALNSEIHTEYRAFVFTGTIGDGDPTWAGAIEEVFKENQDYMDLYLTTHVKATILGRPSKIVEEDYVTT